MSQVYAVIGAQYGDEGKGLVTDYLAANANYPLVVRHNGGAQAGHTVVDPSGRVKPMRHVFHHFGSGTLCGAPTFLSPFFVVSPIFFRKEWEVLEAALGPQAMVVFPWLGRNNQGMISTLVTADPSCRVTTPYDIMLNHAVEDKRGKGRHGSCGLGFNETVVRSECRGYDLRVNDLYLDKTDLKKRLNDIRLYYVPIRARELGVEIDADLISSKAIFDTYLRDCEIFTDRVKLWHWHDFDWSYDVIFEGAQGLLLDEDRGTFPYVTRSKPGLDNVVTLCRQAGIQEKLDVYYVTRCYATRHGAGPFETNKLDWLKDNPDETNVENKYQGGLRKGMLQVNALSTAIDKDRERAGSRVGSSSLVVTCLDQVKADAMIKVVCDMSDYPMHVGECLENLKRWCQVDNLLASHGPTRYDIATRTKTGWITIGKEAVDGRREERPDGDVGEGSTPNAEGSAG